MQSACFVAYALLPIFEKVFPVWIFLVKKFFLLGGQFPRIILKEVKGFLFVKAEKENADFVGIVYPPNTIRFVLLIETI